MKNYIIEIVIGLLSILLGFLIFATPYLSCGAKAKQMKMNYDWGFAKGCMIEHKPSQWIPLENYRVM
jgi:hypothetical protein